MEGDARGVLVVLDGSDTSQRALDLAVTRALERGVSVTCLAIVPPRLWRAKQGQFQMAPEKHDESFAEGLVNQGTARCGSAGVEGLGLVRAGSATAIIVEESQRGYELVVLGERRSLTGAPSLVSIVRHRLAAPLEVVHEE